MDCQSAKEIMPAYLANAATLDEVAKIESHLAVCQECRQHLSKMIDEPVAPGIKPDLRLPTSATAPVRDLEPEPVPVEERPEERLIEKIKAKGSNDKLTLLDYGALIIGIMILGFLLFLFTKK